MSLSGSASGAHLGLQGSEVVTVLSETPGRVVQAIGWVGRVTPVYCTSAGRALLIDAGATEIERLLANGRGLVKHAPRTPRSARAVAARVVAARRPGMRSPTKSSNGSHRGRRSGARSGREHRGRPERLGASLPIPCEVDEAAKELITVSRRISTQIDAQARRGVEQTILRRHLDSKDIAI